jgi:hypothetical protein
LSPAATLPVPVFPYYCLRCVELSAQNLKEATIYNVLVHETRELQSKVKNGHSLLGAKQEEEMLQEIADNEGPKDDVLKAALAKYQAVLESNASWSFADKRVVMKGLAQELRSHG